MLVNKVGGRVFSLEDELKEVGQHCLNRSIKPGELVGAEAELYRLQSEFADIQSTNTQ